MRVALELLLRFGLVLAVMATVLPVLVAVMFLFAIEELEANQNF